MWQSGASSHGVQMSHQVWQHQWQTCSEQASGCIRMTAVSLCSCYLCAELSPLLTTATCQRLRAWDSLRPRAADNLLAVHLQANPPLYLYFFHSSSLCRPLRSMYLKGCNFATSVNLYFYRTYKKYSSSVLQYSWLGNAFPTLDKRPTIFKSFFNYFNPLQSKISIFITFFFQFINSDILICNFIKEAQLKRISSHSIFQLICWSTIDWYYVYLTKFVFIAHSIMHRCNINSCFFFPTHRTFARAASYPKAQQSGPRPTLHLLQL